MKLLLLPFAMLYGLGVRLRNLMFDLGIFKSHAFSVPVLVVGNLRVGGTGKTPTTAWVVGQFKDRLRVAVLSRGYGRSTKGWRLLDGNESSAEVGDEPALIKHLHPEATVAVMEDRVTGIRKLLGHDQFDLIVLDDAMQHRWVSPGHLVLLTAFHDLFTDDFLLPAGRLREHRSQYKRADTIVVTKCPHDLDPVSRRAIQDAIKPMRHQRMLFATESYPGWYELASGGKEGAWTEWKAQAALLVTGLADVTTLISFLKSVPITFDMLDFPDHHEYSEQDLEKIHAAFVQRSHCQVILTTEKDAQRMRKWMQNEKFAALPIRVIKHELEWIGQDAQQAEERINGFIKSYQ